MSMNQRIRNYIKSNGITFTAVAENSGIGIKKFSRFMTGKQLMTTEEYEVICRKGLSLDPAFFYKQKFLESKNISA